MLWWLTIFANPNMITTISPNIYVSKNFHYLSKKSQEHIIEHEMIHLQQQKDVGILKFLFLYIFCLPFFFNKWRWEWEYEAYTKSGTSEAYTKHVLQSWKYGWLRN